MSLAIETADLRLSFGTQEVLRGINLEVARGEALVILGPSGCGKTTYLRALAGLERPQSGRIHLLGEAVFNAELCVPPAERGLGFVFQDLGLWPAMTVLDHLYFVLGPNCANRHECAMARLSDLKIDHLAKKKPAQLSGGEAQRVALARALVADPQLLFLDEPLSSLDPVVAADIRRLLARIHHDEKRTMVYVTHSRDEAFELADRVLLMRDGQIEQLGRPEALATRPRSRFVAEFLGLGSLLPATVSTSGQVTTSLGEHRLMADCPTTGSGWALVSRRALEIVPEGPIQARVLASRFLGDDWAVTLELPDGPLELRLPQHCEPGTTLSLRGPEEVWCLNDGREKS